MGKELHFFLDCEVRFIDDPAFFLVLYDVRASAPNDVYAVGGHNGTAGEQPTDPIILHYDGTAWSLITI